jgi:hypothetical protein
MQMVAQIEVDGQMVSVLVRDAGVHRWVKRRTGQPPTGRVLDEEGAKLREFPAEARKLMDGLAVYF